MVMALMMALVTALVMALVMASLVLAAAGRSPSPSKIRRAALEKTAPVRGDPRGGGSGVLAKNTSGTNLTIRPAMASERGPKVVRIGKYPGSGE